MPVGAGEIAGSNVKPAFGALHGIERLAEQDLDELARLEAVLDFVGDVNLGY